MMEQAIEYLTPHEGAPQYHRATASAEVIIDLGFMLIHDPHRWYIRVTVVIVVYPALFPVLNGP